ncbi:MAG TPA: NlpC/P60 family protein, partial [Clostridium sp.]|uniref:NlpC/P60 family protein n=1 Tax=Clostridium sp. TaxID=1506 RepID=UPI002F955E93
QIFGNLKSVIMVATTALLLFKGVAIEKAMTSFAISMASVIFDVGVMTSVTKGATLAMNNLKIAFTENPLGWVALGITVIASAFMIFNNRTADTIKKQQELRDQMSQVADEYKASKTEIDGLNKLLEEQQTIQAKDPTKLTADEKTRLNDIESQLAGTVPEATTAYDKNNKALAENLDLTKKLVAMKLEEAKGKALEVVSSVNPDDELAKVKKAKAYKDTIEGLMTQKGDEGGSDLRYKTLNSGLAWTQSQEKEIKNTKDQTAVLQFLATAHAGYDKEVTSGTKSLNDYNMAADFTNKNMGTKNKIITDSSVGIGLNTSATDSNTNATTKNASAIDAQAQAEAKSKVEAAAKAEAVKKLTDSFDSSMDSMSSYNKLMEQYNTDGHFSADSVKDIIDNHSELAGYLNNEPALYDKISEAMNSSKDTANKAYAEMMNSSESYYSSNIKGTDTIRKALGEYYNNLSSAQKADLENAKSLAEAKAIVEKELIVRLSKLWDTYNLAVVDVLNRHANLAAQMDSGGDDSAAAEAQLSKIMNANQKVVDAGNNAKKVQDQVNAINTSFSNITADIKAPNIDSVGKSTSATKDNTSATKENASAKADQTEASKALTKANKELADATKQATNSEKDFQSAMKSLAITMSLLDVSQEKLEEHSQAYRDGMKEKAKLIQNEIDLTKKQISLNTSNVNVLTALEGKASVASGNATASEAGNQIVAKAKEYLGTPYVWGGTSTKGFDCSGLVSYVYKELGTSISRTSQAQSKDGVAVAKKNLQPGDLVFFGDASAPHHVGIYMGGDQYLHSPKTGDKVKISTLSSRADYAGARRVSVDGASNISESTGTTSSSSSSSSSSSGKYAGGYQNGKYKDWINEYGAKYGINPNLLAGVIQTESAFNPNARNKGSGATGLGQFLASTAQDEGLSDRTDPESS